MKPIQRNAGDPIPTIIDVSEEFGDHAMLIAPNGPDWAITPPELGSQKLYFEDRFMATIPCPNCKETAAIRVAHFRDSNLFCLETINCCKQFCWGKHG